MLDDEIEETTPQQRNQSVEHAVPNIFDDGTRPARWGTRRFRLVSFEELVQELVEEVGRCGKEPWGRTLVVNPRTSSTGEFTADAMWHAVEFLRELGVAPEKPPR